MCLRPLNLKFCVHLSGGQTCILLVCVLCSGSVCGSCCGMFRLIRVVGIPTLYWTAVRVDII